MSGLPSGIVTFLFTDIEGSTRLVKTLRGRYPQVLAEHRRLVRAAIAGQGGYEVDTQGDAFFVAFGGANQAVLCALEIQRALAGYDWPAGARVRVRIGIHTGNAVPAEGVYTGLAVHRGARICAAARGGQVLVSQATQTIIEDEEDQPGFTLVDLGERKLKDLDRPVRLFQLAAPGLDARAPSAAGQHAGGLAPDMPAEMVPVPVTPLADREREAAAVARPRQLPSDLRFFTGREAELKQLGELLDVVDGLSRDAWAGAQGGLVPIAALSGMAGVGKTALALHWAHKVASQFPDGQLYVNMRGFDADGAPVTADEITGWFLTALGVPAAQIPAAASARAGLYRSVLAERRVLIVLDNARDSAQVRPLLPGGRGCMVIVTSRSALTGLAAADGAHQLRLGPLSQDQAVRLLAVRLGSERVAAEPDAAGDLAGLCGGLPLALAVIAARAAADPVLPLSVFAGELAGAAASSEAISGLDALDTGDALTSLRELFSWSLRPLSEQARLVFAMLGAHCGPDITVPAAASVAGVSRRDARRLVGQLAAASLVAEHRPGRYIMHDLLRGYAAEYARQVLGEAGFGRAVGRSLDHYLQTLATWDISFPFCAEPADGVLIEQLGGNAGLLSWAQAEHQVLLQAIAQALATGRITKAARLFTYVAWYLGDRGWTDCEAAGQGVLAAARAAGDHSSLGWTYRAIGTYHGMLGDNAASFGYLRQALDHCRVAGDKSGQAYAHLALATAYGAQPTGDQPAGYVEAASHAEHGLALCRDVGDQKGQAYALYYLCEINAGLGNYELALRCGQQGMDLLPDGDWWRGVLVSALGNVYHRLGDYARAIACYDEALTINDDQQPSARQNRAALLTELGTAHEAAGNLPAACQAWQQALRIVEDLQLRDDLGYYDIGLRARLRNAGAPGYQTDSA